MTEKKTTPNPFLPIISVFAILSGLFIVFSATLQKYKIDSGVLIGGNILLFGVTMISYLFNRKAILAGNTQVFLRHVYSAILIRFFVCLFAAFIYIYLAGRNVNTGALFSLMFLYMVYTFIEVSGSLRQSKEINANKNG